MSHYTLIVALPGDTDPDALEAELKRRLAPYDEGLDVEPYRQYEDGTAENYWWVRSLRQAAEEHAADEPIKVQPGFGDRPGHVWSHWAGDFITLDEKRAQELAGRAEDAALAERLPTPADWPSVIALYNGHYGHTAAVVVPGDTSIDTEALHYEEETDRAYTWSTDNPESKFDYWRIGGRWGGYFRLKAVDGSVRPMTRYWDSPDDPGPGLRGDAARKGLIDFEAMRADAAEQANAVWDAWESLIAEQFALYNEPPKSWEHFHGLKEAGEIDIGTARRLYNEQPLVRKIKGLGGGDSGATKAQEVIAWADDPIKEFGESTREEYVERERLAAVPGYAFLSLDEEWIAPGRMGWWAMSSDGPGEREGYRRVVNAYIDDKMSDEDFLVALDLHI